MTALAEREAPASALEALRNVADALEQRAVEMPHLVPAATDYTLLMVACYGPLFTWNEAERRYEFQSRRLRPAGALEAARALTAQVVETLGGEYGATIADVHAAIRRLTHTTPEEA